ncbi:MAG: malate synthase A [Planctomycetota bacterium JB042]
MPIAAPATDRDVLTPRARTFLADLTRSLRPRLDALLRARRSRQTALDRGATLGFLGETRALRRAIWKVAPPPDALRRPGVELVGPADRKGLAVGLGAGAEAFVADFEDSSAPTRRNAIEGQRNLADAVRRKLVHEDVARGTRVRVDDRAAPIVVRPRGLHLVERTLLVDGRPIPAALVDVGLFLFHDAAEMISRGALPLLCLPKLESHFEARWWNSALVRAQEALGLPLGSIRAVVEIETLPAAFEMDEILYELRNHASALGWGARDLALSYRKVHRTRPRAVLPDRAQLTTAQPFLAAASRLLVRTCRRRGAVAIGGLSEHAPAPDGGAPDALRSEKEREGRCGFDRTRVAHPALVEQAREELLDGARSADPARLERVEVTAAELLADPVGTRTESGLRRNLRVGVVAVEAWLRGVGRVELDGRSEDTASAEICRAQVWQWLRHGATLSDGRLVSPGLVRTLLDEETRGFEGGRFAEARDLMARLCFAERLADFFTLEGYDLLEPVPTDAVEIAARG